MDQELSFGIGANTKEATSPASDIKSTVPVSQTGAAAAPIIPNPPAINPLSQSTNLVPQTNQTMITPTIGVFPSQGSQKTMPLQTQSSYEFERLMKVNRSMFENLIELQKKNSSLLTKLTESSEYLAKIAKKRHRWEIAKFWTNILFWIALGVLSLWGAMIGYQFMMGMIESVMKPLTQVSESANKLNNINGSLQGFDLGNLLQPQKNNNETGSKEYPSSETTPNSTFTTPAFINDIQNLDLSNVTGENILERLNITPYKAKPVEVSEE
jgi:hypothetical protein